MSVWVADGLPPRSPGRRRGERQHPLVDERVVDDHIRLGEARKGIEGEQAGIARAGTGEPDLAWREDRNAGAASRQCIPSRHGVALPW